MWGRTDAAQNCLQFAFKSTSSTPTERAVSQEHTIDLGNPRRVEQFFALARAACALYGRAEIMWLREYERLAWFLIAYKYLLSFRKRHRDLRTIPSA
jgi:hypothetical protein